jgi:hypothetical protein
MAAQIGRLIPKTPSARTRTNEALLRASSRPRRSSEGNVLLQLEDASKTKKRQQLQLASGTVGIEDAWNLDLSFLDTPHSLKAFINKTRSTQLHEIENWLSISSDFTMPVRKKNFLLFMKENFEWVVLAFMQYFWTDVTAEIQALGRRMHTTCVSNGAPITSHPNRQLLDELPTHLMGLAAGDKIPASKFNSVPKLLMQTVPPSQGRHLFTLDTSNKIPAVPIPHSNLSSAPTATQGSNTAGVELASQNQQMMDNIRAQQVMLETLRKEIEGIRAQPTAESVAQRVVDDALDDVNRGKRLINSVPRSKEDLAKLRSKDIDIENLFVLSAETHPDTGERFNMFEPQAAQDSIRYFTFGKYKNVSDAVKKQMASRTPKIPPEIFSNPGHLSEEDIFVAKTEMAGGAALLKQDEALTRQQISKLNIMQPVLRQLSLLGSNWRAVEQTMELIQELETVTSVDIVSANARNTALVKRACLLMQQVMDRTHEGIEVSSDNYCNLAMSVSSVQKSRDDIAHKIQSGSKDAKLEDHSKTTAADWCISTYKRPEFDGQSIQELSAITNRRIASVQKIAPKGPKANQKKPKWTKAQWSTWNKEKNSRKQQKRGRDGEYGKADPEPEQEPATSTTPDGKGKGGKGKGGKGKGGKGKGKGKGKGSSGNGTGASTAQTQSPTADQ